MYRVVLAAYFTLSLAVAPEPSAVSGPPSVLPVFIDPLGAEPLEPIEGPVVETQAELAATEPGVGELALAPPTTEPAPAPTTETPALSPTAESAVAVETEAASPTPAAVAQLSEAATPTTAATELSETATPAAAGALVASVDLVVEPERSRPSPLPDRPRWTDAVDEALRWRTGACKFAFYAVGPRDCRGDVHRDHLVAWAEAWDSGLGYADAERWYLDDDNLWVMPAGENISKSDDDPAEWRPQDPADWCRYPETGSRSKRCGASLPIGPKPMRSERCFPPAPVPRRRNLPPTVRLQRRRRNRTTVRASRRSTRIWRSDSKIFGRSRAVNGGPKSGPLLDRPPTGSTGVAGTATTTALPATHSGDRKDSEQERGHPPPLHGGCRGRR